jgi:hypothetical protein
MTSRTTLLRAPTNRNNSTLNQQGRDLEGCCHVSVCAELHVDTSRTHHGAGHPGVGLFQPRLPCQHKRKNLVRIRGEHPTVLPGILTLKQRSVEDKAVTDVDAMKTVGAGQPETLVSSCRTTQHII